MNIIYQVIYHLSNYILQVAFMRIRSDTQIFNKSFRKFWIRP